MMKLHAEKYRVCLAFLLVFVVAFLSTSSVRSAQAAGRRPPSSRRTSDRGANERAAKKACITGDVKTGIEILGDLYVDTGDATYVFNQGRCYEQNHRLQEAIDRFREYLLTPTTRALVLQGSF